MPRRLSIVNIIAALIVVGLLAGVIGRLAHLGPGQAWNFSRQVTPSAPDAGGDAAVDANNPNPPVPDANNLNPPADMNNANIPPGSVVIKNAVYGDLPNGGKADVTDRVSDIIKGGTTGILAENDNLGGDPASNIVKKLTVVYSIGGREYSKTVNEHETLMVDTNN